MGRGLSNLQKEILAVLPYPVKWDGSLETVIPLESAMSPMEIKEALGLPKSNSTRASLSRSLAALSKRGLILKWGADVALQGRGYRYTKLY